MSWEPLSCSKARFEAFSRNRRSVFGVHIPGIASEVAWNRGFLLIVSGIWASNPAFCPSYRDSGVFTGIWPRYRFRLVFPGFGREMPILR
jgi:hypothetical protein